MEGGAVPGRAGGGGVVVGGGSASGSSTGGGASAQPSARSHEAIASGAEAVGPGAPAVPQPSASDSHAHPRRILVTPA